MAGDLPPLSLLVGEHPELRDHVVQAPGMHGHASFSHACKLVGGVKACQHAMNPGGSWDRTYADIWLLGSVDIVVRMGYTVRTPARARARALPVCLCVCAHAQRLAPLFAAQSFFGAVGLRLYGQQNRGQFGSRTHWFTGMGWPIHNHTREREYVRAKMELYEELTHKLLAEGLSHAGEFEG